MSSQLAEACAIAASIARAREAAQRAVIGDVLARGEARVEPARIREHARCARAPRAARAVASMPSTSARARRGLHQRGDHAQRGGLAGAVGPEQPGDGAVGRGERARCAHRLDARRSAWRGARLDHRAAHRARAAQRQHEERPRDALAGTCRRASAALPLRMKLSIRRGAQPCRLTPWPRCGATRWRAFGSVAATSSPWRGGVAGSMPPERISAGTLGAHRLVVIVGHARRAARCAHARTKSSTSARPKNDCAEPSRSCRRDARHVLGADHRQVHADREVLGDVVGELEVLREQRVEVAGGRRGDAERQQARELGHVERPEEPREEHVLVHLDRWSRSPVRGSWIVVRTGRRASSAAQRRDRHAQVGIGAACRAPRASHASSRRCSAASPSATKDSGSFMVGGRHAVERPWCARARRGGARTRAPRACRTSRPTGSASS